MFIPVQWSKKKENVINAAKAESVCKRATSQELELKINSTVRPAPRQGNVASSLSSCPLPSHHWLNSTPTLVELVQFNAVRAR